MPLPHRIFLLPRILQRGMISAIITDKNFTKGFEATTPLLDSNIHDNILQKGMFLYSLSKFNIQPAN